VRDRKLLLHRKELKKLQRKLKDQGVTIVPVRAFFAENGMVKVEIALAKGKKTFD
jgi:SsrA-binding protein